MEQWCDAAGLAALAEVKARVASLALALRLGLASRGRLGLERIDGLGDWLGTVGLATREADVRQILSKSCQILAKSSQFFVQY